MNDAQDLDGGTDGVSGAGLEPSAPVWAAFGDLMAGLLGAFVLLLAFAMGLQLDLATQLQDEVKKRQAEEQRRQALEQALALPLAEGRITLEGGRIGISSNVLFAVNSAQLQPEGQALLKSLATTLAAYRAARDELLMVSGFTDNQQVLQGNQRFTDNWELSAQRALTVTRALVEGGVPSSALFAAGFGAEQPVASNDSEAGRARNRRVEITPTPRPAALPTVQKQRAASPDTPEQGAQRGASP
jgi:outer membrane protein OmpA-like peptidoglycan-associated protein